MTQNVLNIFIFNILQFFFIDCHLVLSLKYLPVYKSNYSTPIEIMRSTVITKLYAIIEIGTPKQIIEIPLDFKSSDFYISDSPIKDFEKKSELFSDLKFYNLLKSSSRVPQEDVYYNGLNFNIGEYSVESFFLNNSKYELGFYLPFQLNYPESGGLGLLLYSKSEATSNRERTFLTQIKNKKLTEDYYWSVFYDSKEITDDEKGFILLGPLPEELKLNLGYYNYSYFNKDYLKPIYVKISGGVLTNIFTVDEITFFEGSNRDKIKYDFPTNITELKDIEINYHSRGVQAPYTLLEKYRNFFKEYISKEECFEGEFNDLFKKYFFYCKNNKETIDNIKKTFPGFNFLSKKLEHNFTLDANDLFFEKNEYVFCLMYFHYSEYIERNWIMGKPFLRKYQFIFNPDKKQLFFYSNRERENGKDKEENNGEIRVEVKGNHLLIILLIIFITIIVVSSICFVLFKYYLYDKFNRKKRANELDDDFDYIQKKENDNHKTLGINNVE